MKRIAIALVVLAVMLGVANAGEKPSLFELRDEKLLLRDDTVEPAAPDPSKPGTRPVVLKVPLAMPIRDVETKTTSTTPTVVPLALETIRSRVARSWQGTRALSDGTFGAKIVPPIDKTKDGWTLVVSFDRSVIERAGSYRLAIDLHVDGTAERLQTLTLVLERPAPKIRAIPDTILIEIDQSSWFPEDVETIPATSIAIVETQGEVPAIVDVRDSGASRNDGHPVSGLLTAGQLTVPPGAEAALALTLKGNLPPGKTSGKIALQPRDGERIELPYEIRTRLGLRSILLMLVFGWLIGVGLRTGLAWAATRFRRAQEIIAIQTKASRLAASIKDQSVDFNSVVKACEKARHKLRIPEDVATKLQKELDTKMAEFQPRLDAARATVRDLANAVTPAWKLAPDIQAALAPFRAAILSSTRFLAENDATKATALLKDVFDGPAKLLFSRVESWRRSAVDAVANLTSAPDIDEWPEAARQPSKDIASSWKSKILEVPTEAPLDPSSLLRLCRALHGARVNIEDGAIAIAATWKLVAEATVATLSDLKGPPLTWLVGALPEIGDGESYPTRIVLSARAIVAKLTTELLERIPKDSPFRKNAEEALSAGKWALAAKLAHDTAQPPSAGFRLGDYANVREVAFADPKRTIAIEPAPSLAELPHFEAEAKRAKRWELAAVVSTSILSGVILIIVSAISIARNQPATCMDMLAIAAQAFSVDVGVAAVVTTLKNVVK